jgi:hypothetical protein
VVSLALGWLRTWRRPQEVHQGRVLAALESGDDSSASESVIRLAMLRVEG